eukprot:SAG31_NODE_1114_length_9852_cov_2.761509_9_plen_57_part_00
MKAPLLNLVWYCKQMLQLLVVCWILHLSMLPIQIRVIQEMVNCTGTGTEFSTAVHD